MPSFNTRLSNALQSADEVLVKLPGNSDPFRCGMNFNEYGDDGNGNMIFYPITLSLENHNEDLVFEEATVQVTDGIILVRDRAQNRPIVILVGTKRPLQQNDLIDKNA